MIEIVMKNGHTYTYAEGTYDEYQLTPKLFIVKRGQQWVGIFNVESIEAVCDGREGRG